MLNDPLKAWPTFPPTETADPTLLAVKSKVAVIGTEIGASIAVMSTNVLLEIVVTPPDTVAATWSVSLSCPITARTEALATGIETAAERAPTADKSKIFLMAQPPTNHRSWEEHNQPTVPLRQQSRCGTTSQA